MRFVIIILLVLLALSASAAQAVPFGFGEQSQLFERALAQHGLELADVRLNTDDMGIWGGDKYRLNILDVFFNDPFKSGVYTRALTDGLLLNCNDASKVIVSAHQRTDHGVRIGLLGNPTEGYEKRLEELRGDALASALGEISNRPAQYYSTNDAYGEIPPTVAKAAALILIALPDALEYRHLALENAFGKAGVTPQKARATAVEFLISRQGEVEDSEEIRDVLLMERLADNTDWSLLNTGATLLTTVVEKAATMLAGAEGSGKRFSFSADTPLGRIAICGGGQDVYPAGDYLLIIDTGGSDIHHGGAGCTSLEVPASITIDLAGDDIYENYDEYQPAFGAGIFGYALCYDLAGNDEYYSPYASQGCGIFGTGILRDFAGNDSYGGIGHLQACGMFGTGMLIDNAGDDEYQLCYYGQGYGFTMGCGMLLDKEGNDKYTGKMEGEPNGGPFGAERFIHFAQGAAYGRRADFTDGHSWAGGVGILADGAGDDEYQCEVYGQGTGYWYATGMCVDKGGNDVHHAGWYSLGGAPHFAVGIMQDDGGDDRYILRQMQSMGNGRDFSLGWFEDRAGNDYYQGGIMTFGVGDLNGIGVFWDKAGDDTYIAKGPSFGQSRMEAAGSLRDYMLTLGMFVDGGGADRYCLLPGDITPTGEPTVELASLDGLELLPFTGDGKMWTRATDQNTTPGSFGCGIDGE